MQTSTVELIVAERSSRSGWIWTAAHDPARRAARASAPAPAPRRAATRARAAPARSWSTGGAINVLPHARRSCIEGRRGHDHRGSCERRRRCTRCRRPSSSTTPSSAATARPARSCPPSRCSPKAMRGSTHEIREWMSGNICRCGAYPNIVAAIAEAAQGGLSMRAVLPIRPRAPTQDAIAAAAAGGSATSPAAPTLVDLMREEVERPERAGRHQRACLARHPAGCRRRLVIGALARMTDVAAHPATHGGSARARRGAAGRRFAAAAQHGLDRRQPAAADALPLLPRASMRPATSAPPAPAARPSTASTAATRSSAPATTASPPTPRTSRSPWSRSTPVVRSRAGGRATIPVDDLYRLPGATPHLEHTLDARRADRRRRACPTAAHARRSRYLKVRDRASYEFALVSVAAALEIEDGVIRAARLAAGGVGTRPWRLRASEAALAGQRGGPVRMASRG